MANGTTFVIPVWDTIASAWDKVRGSKKIIWGAMLLFMAIMFIFGVLQGMLEGVSSGGVIAVEIIANIIPYFMQMGLMYMGIKRAADLPIEYKQIFRVFDTAIAPKIVLLYVFQVLIFLPVVIVLIGASVLTTMIPTLTPVAPVVIFVIGGIALLYLSIRMMISNALVLDKVMNPWTAIKTSFKATRCNFWPCLGLILLQLLILAISAIPLGIGLIWTLPFAFICYGMIYKRLQLNLM